MAMRREVDAAMRQASSARSVIQPERITITVQLEAHERQAANGSTELLFSVSGSSEKTERTAKAKTGGTQIHAHTLSIEFRASLAPPAGQAGLDQNSAGGTLQLAGAGTPGFTGTEEENAVRELSKVFGPPGFDSSARATVFREAISTLTDSQMARLIEFFDGAAFSDPDPAAKKSQHLISGVLKSGPLKSLEAAREIIAGILSKHPLDLILELIEKRWKTQDDWLGE